ncbi:MAG: peptidylprolyl isomerase [Alphaproteobacteria bacterium]|nr:peptidylprolyl isomerase [Alphaproteobacteria bacterium]MDX5415635.1 peptidylprolyl isomerase [Alphaproteobacteria bacterium]MDX5492895.1 peptidylprolyl isomerase [Alphaproteobacteria bacterium]
MTPTEIDAIPAPAGASRLSRLIAVAALIAGLAMPAAVPAVAQTAADAAAPATMTSDTQGIAAVVNELVISSYDLDQRVKLVLLSSGIPNTPENVTRIRGQVLRSLVDEYLKAQEAQRLNITVSQEEVDQAFERIAQRSNMTADQITETLKEGGISRATLEQQIRIDMAWNRAMQQRFAPLVTVGDNEIDEVMRRLQEESGEPRYLVSEILISFDNPGHADEIAAGAQRLADQIRQGAPFEAVARQFSQSASAANGGDIGWVHASQLPDGVREVVTQMQPDMVSDPIRTLNGFYIIALKAMQTGTGADPMRDQYLLMQVLLPLTPDADPQAVNRRAREVNEFRNSVNSCEEAEQQIKKYVSGVASPPQQAIAGQLDPRVRQAIAGVPVGKASEPIRSDRGVEMIVVCAHRAAEGEMPTREQIDSTLFEQQLSMMSRRHLRDLRRDAVVVYR